MEHTIPDESIDYRYMDDPEEDRREYLARREATERLFRDGYLSKEAYEEQIAFIKRFFGMNGEEG